ncbi:hypothetical protein BN2475_170025 [Paraburkholderia ribeironis]|uniref:Uncharacterized protein n=1 Tax=Paraburkholderia ribeironis TaxID=1247936 RepID=A0A1N7RUF5_9BURK|nr:hypothetical protein BN2475_170025 [Paraburkholderia ribeironis]
MRRQSTTAATTGGSCSLGRGPRPTPWAAPLERLLTAVWCIDTRGWCERDHLQHLDIGDLMERPAAGATRELQQLETGWCVVSGVRVRASRWPGGDRSA